MEPHTTCALRPVPIHLKFSLSLSLLLRLGQVKHYRSWGVVTCVWLRAICFMAIQGQAGTGWLILCQISNSRASTTPMSTMSTQAWALTLSYSERPHLDSRNWGLSLRPQQQSVPCVTEAVGPGVFRAQPVITFLGPLVLTSGGYALGSIPVCPFVKPSVRAGGWRRAQVTCVGDKRQGSNKILSRLDE